MTISEMKLDLDKKDGYIQTLRRENQNLKNEIKNL